MFVVTKLPGEGVDLSVSLSFIILGLAEAWSLELRRNPLPSFYSFKPRYEPEPGDSLAEEWCDPYTVYERGFGDCDDLVIWRLAEIFVENNYDPRNGRKNVPAWPAIYAHDDGVRYHVAIHHRNGKKEDPALLASQGYKGKNSL